MGIDQFNGLQIEIRLLHAFVLDRALADRVIDQVKQLSKRLHKGGMVQLGMRCGDVSQFLEEGNTARFIRIATSLQ